MVTALSTVRADCTFVPTDHGREKHGKVPPTWVSEGLTIPVYASINVFHESWLKP